MRNEALSRQNTPPPLPQTGRPSGEYRIKQKRNPYSDEDDLGTGPLPGDEDAIPLSEDDYAEEELDERDITEITRTEAGRLTAKRQAAELAKEFPGLIIDNNERSVQKEFALQRAIRLDDERMELASQRKKVSSLREGMGTTSTKDSQAPLDQIRVSQDLLNAKKQMEFYSNFPDAQSEIADMVSKLEERRERVQNNPLTVKGIDAKIAKLNRLSVLLDKAENYEHPDDATSRRQMEAQQRRDKIGKDRIRAHEIWKKQRGENGKTEQKPPRRDINLEASEEQKAVWQEKHTRNQRSAQESRKRAAQRPFKEAMKAHQSILEEIADKLASQGIAVDLPWQTKNFKIPSETIGNKLTGFLFGKPKADSTRDLMNRYRVSAQKWVEANEALEKL